MLDAFKSLFAAPVGEAPEARERTLRIAAGVLLFEIVRADGKVTDSERTVMRAALQGTFGLSAADTEELMAAAETHSRQASSLYEFTAPIDARFSNDEKKRIVELLWLVAFADGEKAPTEEHMVRKISGLLHVAHPDFIDAKLKARGRSDPSSSG